MKKELQCGVSVFMVLVLLDLNPNGEQWAINRLTEEVPRNNVIDVRK
jgi:hypothetical protein